MELTTEVFAEVNDLLDDIQKTAESGAAGEKARESCMEISGTVYKIRRTLWDKTTVSPADR